MKIRAVAFVAGFLLAASPLLANAATTDAMAPPPPGYHPDATTDEGGLWMVTQRAEHEIAVSPNLVKDAALNAYVKSIACKLSADQCAAIRLYIVEAPQFNAYMMPNGALVVFTGLLLRMNSEAQLAYVLGHEMTHYTRKHTLDQFRRMTTMSNVMAFVSLITAGVGVGLLGTAMQTAAIGNMLAYNRDQEREADDGGFDLGVAAGYDPDQAARNWQSIADEHKANPRRNEDYFFSTHPADAERLATLGKRAGEIEASRADWTTNANAYRDAVKPSLTRWLDDEINRGEPEESVVLLNRLVTDQPESGTFRYYLGVAYRKRGRPDDAKNAGDAYAQAISTGTAPPAVWRDEGLLAMKAGDKAGARDDFGKYLAAAPSADDKAMIQYYLTQLAGT